MTFKPGKRGFSLPNSCSSKALLRHCDLFRVLPEINGVPSSNSEKGQDVKVSVVRYWGGRMTSKKEEWRKRYNREGE
jgi:hypothetical protein